MFSGPDCGRGEEIGEGGVAVGLMVGAEAFGLEIEEQALGEVFFVFDQRDEGGLRVGGHRADPCMLGWTTLASSGTRPFHAICTPMQSRMKADDAQDSVGCGGRDVARDAVRVRVAEVDGEAQDEDGDQQAGVGEQVVADRTLRGVRGEREHDDDAAGAGGDGKGEGVEDLLPQIADEIVRLHIRGGLHLFGAGSVSSWLSSDQPMEAMTSPPATWTMGSEMPKKRSSVAPTRSMTTRRGRY